MTGNTQAVILIVTKNKTKNHSNFRLSLSNQAKFENTSDFQNPFSLYITTFLYTCIIVIHWINHPWKWAKVGQGVSWWSGGQTCYQVPLSIAVKLVKHSSGIIQSGRECSPTNELYTKHQTPGVDQNRQRYVDLQSCSQPHFECSVINICGHGIDVMF